MSIKQKIKIKDLNELCDSASSISSKMIISKKRVRRRISSDSEKTEDIISIHSSQPATPKKKLCLKSAVPTKKKTNSLRKKKILDGSNCKQITDFFTSTKKNNTSNTNKSQETEPVKKSEKINVKHNFSTTQPVTSKIQKITKVRKNLKFNSNLEAPATTINNTQPIMTQVKDSRIFRNIENVPSEVQCNDLNKHPAAKKVPPQYKFIEGTTFAVDAFNFGNIEGVTDYFLTHFHADHYIGLKKGFQFPLYMTKTTANLVNAFIKVDPKFFRILNLNETHVVGNCTVVAIDANHCPGAVMLLFNINGKSVLHTGDFRACPSMEEEPLFWNYDIDSIYLDTTYLSCKSQHCSQNESIQIAIEIIRKYKTQHIGDKVLIICGAYLIGKEKMWLKIAEAFNKQIWTEPRRREALKWLENEEINKRLVEKKEEAGLHILSMGKGLVYENIVKYVENLEEYFTHAIVIKPSGWELNSRPRIQGNITIVGVEYSEHSSFEEMRRFIRFLRPKSVISTVPIGRGHRTPKVPESWFLGEIKPRTKQQQAITNFVKYTHKENMSTIPLPECNVSSDEKSDWMS